jgi:hypothetical protein
MLKIHISRMKGRSWAEAVLSKVTSPLTQVVGLSACFSSSTFTFLFDVLRPHTPTTLPSCASRAYCEMIPDRQLNATTMPLDQEGMKGYDVDGAIPERYLGSAGELLSLSGLRDDVYTDKRQPTGETWRCWGKSKCCG